MTCVVLVTGVHFSQAQMQVFLLQVCQVQVESIHELQVKTKVKHKQGYGMCMREGHWFSQAQLSSVN